jgi:glycosyltransferase involved in cell wall biosynthesis
VTTSRGILILSHVSSVDRAIEMLKHRSVRTDDCELLVYGRSSSDYPVPPGIDLISTPPRTSGLVGQIRDGLALVRQLRAQRYSSILIAQPGLAQHYARGLLLGFAALVGPAEIQTLYPAGGDCQEVPRSLAFRDGVSWILMRPVARVIMELSVIAVNLLGKFWLARPRQTAPMGNPPGSVMYLRTDVELIGAELDAGGSAAHTAGVIGALTRAGWSVQLRSTGEITGVGEGVHRTQLAYWAPANVPKELAELVSGFRQARSTRPAGLRFVYQRYSLNNLAGALLARRWCVPLILEANDSEVNWRESAGNLTYGRLARRCERYIFGAADRIVAVSANAAKELELAGGPANRIRVVPNGVDVERFQAAAPVPLPFAEDCFVVGFVGLFYPWHGVRVLAEAFVELHRHYPKTRLLLVGDGEERPHVVEILRRGAAMRSSFLTGAVRRAQIPGYLAAMDVAVASHADIAGFIGSPIKLFEYMAAGKAIVASRVGQISEILRDQETALLVAPGDPRELAQALRRLHEDPGLRRRLGANAGDEAARIHTWNSRVHAILAS